MVKGIIFDLDGTLINSLPDIAASMNRALEKSGLPTFPEEAYKYKTGNGVLKLTERSIGEHTECFQQVLADYSADYAENCQVGSYAYKGMAEVLQALVQRGISVCVLSNKDQADAEKVLSHYYPTVSFTVIQGRREGMPLKPDPASALAIAKKLGCEPSDIWYVGDTSTDMSCGNGAGMETIGVLWGFRPREELVASGAHQLIVEPEELLSLVEHE